MQSVTHPLPFVGTGTAQSVVAQHFGEANCGRKVYVQAALHADEIPAMLVATRLREKLLVLEAQGRLRAEVVLLSVANPLGLNQWLMGAPQGRFELASGRNYNRSFPMLSDAIVKLLEQQPEALTDDIARNRDRVRAAWREALLARPVTDAFGALQSLLMLQAHDADIVLDLHCSREATMHLYTGDECWPAVEPLARYLGSKANLLALDSGAHSFDEAQSYTWYQLRQHFGATYPMPSGPVSVTVEHRGQRDVSYEQAEADASAILQYLTYTGDVDGQVSPLPDLPYPATPLAGSEQFRAPCAGVLVHRAVLGALVEIDQPVFDIVDPVTGDITTLVSRTQGVMYMRRDVRFVNAGDPLGRVTGHRSQRTGMLLGA
ncbi:MULTISPECIES: succinylglutamate desuccinylase/aspartoacylase family protein [Pandoraea]|uniref:succinylglutamate desuccinylase/aspartoacylase family protein n=1 Tax=Pandoraea TaxID=93217 RepID=UPI001F5D109B|nr:MULTISPECIES: succinylglutamate desuccinylase/aspartoacylase family protein [Pandoraea]MCI3208757.1 succinylglutamate desuccinylase [Pandoraea sp. LA3]MDN4586786.1 succinylglutamate desuccinylase [Pandoraea capi]